MTNIGFIGGTGVEGKGLALRLAAAGSSVVIGSREETRAVAAADQYNKILEKPSIRGLSNRDMLAASDIVFLTVKFDQAVAAVEMCREYFRPGQILVDVTVPVRFEKGQPGYLDQPDSLSGAEWVARSVPEGIPVVGGFKTMPAKVLADLGSELCCDEFICGDSKEARLRVMGLARTIPTLRPLDVGPLRMARILERMTVLAIQLNRLNRTDACRFRIVGVEPR
jgi:NADPH-dependent F420 reductase